MNYEKGFDNFNITRSYILYYMSLHLKNSGAIDRIERICRWSNDIDCLKSLIIIDRILSHDYTIIFNRPNYELEKIIEFINSTMNDTIFDNKNLSKKIMNIINNIYNYNLSMIEKNIISLSIISEYISSITSIGSTELFSLYLIEKCRNNNHSHNTILHPTKMFTELGILSSKDLIEMLSTINLKEYIINSITTGCLNKETILEEAHKIIDKIIKDNDLYQSSTRYEIILQPQDLEIKLNNIEKSSLLFYNNCNINLNEILNSLPLPIIKIPLFNGCTNNEISLLGTPEDHPHKLYTTLKTYPLFHLYLASKWASHLRIGKFYIIFDNKPLLVYSLGTIRGNIPINNHTYEIWKSIHNHRKDYQNQISGKSIKEKTALDIICLIRLLSS